MGMIVGSELVEAAPPSEATTWNPADKNGFITLALGNLKATSTPVGEEVNQGSVRATKYRDTGKFYFEVFLGLSVNYSIGIANAAWDIDGPPGTGTAGAVQHGSDGGIFYNSLPLLGAPDPLAQAGDIMSVAVDLTAAKIWFRINNRNWLDNGAANPATGANGVTGWPAGLWTPSFRASTLNQYAILNAGASAFAHSVPAGFTGWDG